MPEIERFQKIQILLAEYNGVRAHIISRTTTSVQILVLLIGSVAATAVQAKSSFAIGIGVTLFIFISLSVVLFLITTDLLEESRQSVELERRINELSGCEEPLLTWETDHGAVNGLMRPFRKRRNQPELPTA